MVGLTACNALSERFEIIVSRYGKRYTIGFHEGELSIPLKETNIKDKNLHGTTIVMTPSQKYMGNCPIISDDLTEWLDKMVYLTPSDISTTYSIKKAGKEAITTKKYKNKNGLYDYCKKLCKKPLLDPIHFKVNKDMTQNIGDRTIERHIGLEVAFTYNSTGLEFEADSFCNFVNTIDNGVHVDAVKNAIMNILSKETKESLSAREANKVDITYNDVAQGLVMTVYLSTDLPVEFTSQTKSKVGADALFKPIRELAYKAITKYFKDNPKELKKCCDRVKVNAKARIEATKVRNSVIKKETNDLSDHLMDNFVPCNNKGKGEYREIFLIEGDSARGSCSLGRFNRDTQAIYSFKGVPLNSFGLRIDRVLQNDEFRGLVRVLKTNIGPAFDINKLFYDKIIIMSDSDSDGYFITSSICAFFMAHMRPLVEAGKVYKAIAPLYELTDKKYRFVRNKAEYIDVFEKIVRKAINLYDVNTGVQLTDDEFKEMLMYNRPYLEDLNRVAKQLPLEPILLEFLLTYRNDKNFNKLLKKHYPEIKIEEDVLSGVVDGKIYIIIMDDIFEKRVATLDRYFNNNRPRSYIVKEKTSNGLLDKGEMSVGSIMSMITKYQPVIKTRFKGLGELDPEDLCETTLDPNNRILVQLTTEDMERELDIFDALHGNNSDSRKEIMKHFTINREDLDN